MTRASDAETRARLSSPCSATNARRDGTTSSDIARRSRCRATVAGGGCRRGGADAARRSGSRALSTCGLEERSGVTRKANTQGPTTPIHSHHGLAGSPRSKTPSTISAIVYGTRTAYSCRAVGETRSARTSPVNVSGHVRPRKTTARMKAMMRIPIGSSSRAAGSALPPRSFIRMSRRRGQHDGGERDGRHRLEQHHELGVPEGVAVEFREVGIGRSEREPDLVCVPPAPDGGQDQVHQPRGQQEQRSAAAVATSDRSPASSGIDSTGNSRSNAVRAGVMSRPVSSRRSQYAATRKAPTKSAYHLQARSHCTRHLRRRSARAPTRRLSTAVSLLAAGRARRLGGDACDDTLRVRPVGGVVSKTRHPVRHRRTDELLPCPRSA